MATESPRKKRISIVTPCFNEEEVIRLFYVALKEAMVALPAYEHRLMFIDDGSSDSTLEVLNALAAEDDTVRVFSFSRNFGHQIALTAGLDAARGDAVVMMDSDLQHPPSLIATLVAKWEEGYDVVSAVRERTEDAGLLKRVTSDGFYHLFNALSDTKLTVGAADFCLLSERARVALCRMPERHRFLRGLISWLGYRRAFVPYTAPPRPAGHSKYTVAKMVALSLNAIMSFSAKPVRVATRLGIGSVCLGVAYFIYVVYRYFGHGDVVQGWASLMCVVLILGGMQLAFIGLIGDYVARIFEESKGRPIYLLKQAPEADT